MHVPSNSGISCEYIPFFFFLTVHLEVNKYYNWFGSKCKWLVTLLPPNSSSMNEFWIIVSKYSENSAQNMHF